MLVVARTPNRGRASAGSASSMLTTSECHPLMKLKDAATSFVTWRPIGAGHGALADHAWKGVPCKRKLHSR